MYRTLQWRDYDCHEQTIRLRPEHSKNQHGRVLPVVGELATVLDRRLVVRRLECRFIFHRHGEPLGDFRKPWKRACATLRLAGRLVNDLRRSGVKHLFRRGCRPAHRHGLLRPPHALDAAPRPHHRARRPPDGGSERKRPRARLWLGDASRRSENPQSRPLGAGVAALVER